MNHGEGSLANSGSLACNERCNIFVNMSNSQRLVYDLRRRGVAEVPMVGRYRYTAAQSELPPHDHPDCYEFCFLAAGRQVYRVGDRDYALRGGDVFFTRPGEEHSSGGRPQERGILYWLIVQRPLPRQPWLGLAAEAARSWDGRWRRARARCFAPEGSWADNWEQILQIAVERAGPWREARLRLAVANLLIRMVEEVGKPTTRRAGARLEQVLAWSETRIAEPVTLAEWAESAGLSLPRFKAWFRAEMGMPPAAYRLLRRIETAEHWLAEKPQVSVTEIAHALGFDSSHFATAFKRHTGRRPSDGRG